MERMLTLSSCIAITVMAVCQNHCHLPGPCISSSREQILGAYVDHISYRHWTGTFFHGACRHEYNHGTSHVRLTWLMLNSAQDCYCALLTRVFSLFAVPEDEFLRRRGQFYWNTNSQALWRRQSAWRAFRHEHSHGSPVVSLGEFLRSSS